MSTSRWICLSLAGLLMFSADSKATEPREAPASDVTEGIVTLADSRIQYFSRGKGEKV
jgi:hypothetical protein